ncbi:hypothetical protein D3C84_1156960 [compost metagenome]
MAGGGDTLFDQNANAVFHEIRFSQSLCNVAQIQSAPNFPAGTTEPGGMSVCGCCGG